MAQGNSVTGTAYGGIRVAGSTNGVIHLLAIAGRVGVPVDLEDWDRLGRTVPTIVDLMPSGRFLMEEFYRSQSLGGIVGRNVN